ncbi:MAG: DNA-protecting protein DprA [Microthrixaceae bacterium]|nr:DNA-protecting protein DprA [Microthrixaceae bacterium]
MGEALPPEAHGAALCTLPGMGPARLVAVARAWPDLAEAWGRVLDGRIADEPTVAAALGRSARDLRGRGRPQARRIEPGEVLDRHRSAGGVSASRGAAYPEALAGDVEPPVVLFHRGRPDVLAGPRVAVVGTRDCTGYGRQLARRLGRDLAVAGVRVVSGLALGIDGAAHEGALRVEGGGPPVAVVGSGLDVVYPRAHGALWAQVEETGVVLSEAPLGAAPERWRFPSRNRVVAALADVVVVVESPRRGGSLHTVDAALERDVPVLAVPGPVTSPTSAGCNQLLADAVAGVARDAGDVLSLLGLSQAAVARGGADPRPSPTPDQAAVLDAFGWQPAVLEQLAVRTALGLGTVAEALHALEAAGWVAASGGWYERVARPDR